jgi:hypothetical protein
MTLATMQVMVFFSAKENNGQRHTTHHGVADKTKFWE